MPVTAPMGHAALVLILTRADCLAAEKGENAMKRILVPINSSDDSLEAVKEVVRQADRSGRVQVHLLHVQVRMLPEESLVLSPVQTMDHHYHERSRIALAPAEKLLRDAGVAFVSHRMIGRIAEAILEKQRELECASIVMSAKRGRGAKVSSWSSVCAMVQKRSPVPVDLIKVAAARNVRDRLSAA